MSRFPLISALVAAFLFTGLPCAAYASRLVAPQSFDGAEYDGAELDVQSGDREVWDGEEDTSGVTFDVAGGCVYTGQEVKPPVTNVRLGDEALAEGVDYTVSYANNVHAGVASVTVSPLGDRTFKPKKANFPIGRLPLSQASITLSGAGVVYDQDGLNPSTNYDGREKTPSVSVEVGGVSLSMGTDFSVAYSDNLAVGIATVKVSAAASGNCSGSKSITFSIGEGAECVLMTRLYNPWTGEHLYTSSVVEVGSCVSLGWENEGVAWAAPAGSAIPVYRLYNPYTGDHLFTISLIEYETCAKDGWSKEGIACYSADRDSGVAVYRGFNPHATVATHHYVTNRSELDNLLALGWMDEGTAWYGLE